MPYKKGESGNLQGKPKGAQNHVSKELRNILKEVVANELSTLAEAINKLDTDKRVEMLIKLLPYVLPKIETVKMDRDEPGAFGWD